MKFFSTLLASLTISLSLISVTTAGDLIANINYGETRDIIANKLSKSNLVTSGVDSSLLARTGLNGSFKTTRDLAGLKFSLYFDWTDSSGLKEMTYRSDSIPASQYDQKVKKSWKHAINVISAIYGRASNAGDYPKKAEVTPGQIQFSHEWKTNRGYIYLGVGKETNDYSLNITFSRFSLEEK